MGMHDIFLHLLDAWTESELSRGTFHRQLERRQQALDAFMSACGDRFEDTADLERMVDEWSLRAPAPVFKAAKPVLDQILTMWRSYED